MSFIAFFDSWKLYGLCPTVIITVEETEKMLSDVEIVLNDIVPCLLKHQCFPRPPSIKLHFTSQSIRRRNV